MGWDNNRLGRQLRRQKLLAVGLLLCFFMVMIAIAARVVAPQDPYRIDSLNRIRPPSATHWFGTDNFGRDVFARVVYGSRISLLVGSAVVVITAVSGIALGAVAGYFSRWDNMIMRTMDALMAFPAIMLAIAVTAALGPSILNVLIALGVTYMPRTARIVRASVLVVRETEFVEAARANGATDLRIICVHILPNTLAPLIVQLTFIFAYAVLAEAVLSFLGMGTPPPTPSWGNIVAEGRNVLRAAPWVTLYPGLAIAIFVLGLNLLGDGLRDWLDPRMQVERG